MSIRFLVTALAPAFVGLLLLLPAAAAEPRPSVLLILADDQGWGDLSYHGNQNLETPHLDSLVEQGASFARFYVEPVCSPTRAELLTGCYAHRSGVTDVTAGGERMDPAFPTIADAFRNSGYATAAFGKWHNGTQAPYHPLCRGFDFFYGFTSGHWADYFDPMLDRNGEITRGKGFLPDDMTDEAIQFIEKNRDRPFFALIAFNTPHSPMQVPERWWRPHSDRVPTQRGTEADREEIDHTRAALAMCENLDWNVGRLLQAVKDLEIEQRTIVVYLSDNGPNGYRFNGGLRGIKGSTDEGGTRSPLFIRWAGRIASGTQIKQNSAVVDLAPTLAELTGVSLVPGPAIDGVSWAPPLLGKPEPLQDRTLFTHWNGRTAARRGSFVLDADGRLYDLTADAGQTTDIAREKPAEARRLREEVSRWQHEVRKVNGEEQGPLTVGYPPIASTQLPARDARTRGGIRRSSAYFNSTFFTHWKSVQDAIVWDVALATPGRFRATVYYTCPQSDIGSLVELRQGESACRARVAVAFDPPLTASKHDRFPRIEGDMKVFKPLQLGELNLSAGRGDLVLQALEIPGKQVMDFRLLVLQRIE